MPSGEPCPRPDAKDTSCTLRPCCALVRAEPPQLRPLSKCESHILTAALMLRTVDRKRHTLKATFRLTCAQSRRNCLLALRALRAQPLLSSPLRLTRSPCATVASKVFPPSDPPWRAGRRALGQSALARRQLQHCLNRRNGSTQKSPVCCRHNRLPRVETGAP